MSVASSNIRVFVHFKESTVFAGDEIECTITFKNVDVPNAPRRPSLGASQRSGVVSRRTSQGAVSPATTPSRALPIRQNSGGSYKGSVSRLSPTEKAERPVLSLNVVDSVGHYDGASPSPRGINIADTLNISKNERKVSIISLGQKAGKSNIRRTSHMGGPRSPPFAHRRSISASQSGSPNMLSPSSIMATSRPSLARSPLSSTSAAPFLAEPDFYASLADSPSRRLSQAPPKLLRTYSADVNARSPGTLSPNDMQPPLRKPSPNGLRKKKPPMLAPFSTNFPAVQIAVSDYLHSPLDGAPSIASPDRTPRSSIDVYNIANDSNDTLPSDNITPFAGTSPPRAPDTRNPSLAGRVPVKNRTETLMMGFAQVSGSFTLDGSLVSEGDFEEVKRKAVVGGQGGGGVIGIEKNRNSGGIFGNLGWGSLAQSFGGLLGGDELSTIKEMKVIADSKSIPLISTPKSILFVDLHLAPGESRSYRFSFTLPRGLPPSHKGRAIKVTYHLVVGTQRPGIFMGKQQQPIRSVEIPFRVFGGVNILGEVLGHNLMSPYIVLRDQARTSVVYDAVSTASSSTVPAKPQIKRRPSQYAAGLREFQSYVDYLLMNPRKNSSFGLLSPTVELETRRPSYVNQLTAPAHVITTRELIDLAVRRNGQAHGSEQSPTNFTIAKASQLIANVVLSRAAFKLGDVVSCVVDFVSAQTMCYGLEMTLESSEKVDPSLAIRSTQSVERATRRSWARNVDSALWSRRCVFNAQIPMTATPTFSTTGVSLDWCIRIEFVVSRENGNSDQGEDRQARDRDDEGVRQKVERLLDEISSDERGTSLSATSYVGCESFEVIVPIKVFGAALGDAENGTGTKGLSI